MEGILKLLRKLGYSEDEIKTVLNKVPVNQEGLTGTNVATGIFSKPKKGELAKDFLVSDTIGNPFEVNYFKGRSEKDILISAEAQLKMIDDELTKLTDQLLNKNLQLSEAQQINFAKNLETRKRFKKDFEAFKTKPEAEVLNIKTGETVTDLKKLIDEQGTKNPPTTVAGQLETTGKRLEQKGKELEEVTKPKSVIGDIMRDYSDFNKYMQSSQKTGYVRATVRQIMREDIQAGKLKLSKELQDQVMQGTGEPIDVYRKVYGEGALEQIDSLADDLGQFRTEEEAAKFARSKYTIEPKTNPVSESNTYDELENIIKEGPNKPEGKANGGAMGLDYLTGQEPPKNGYAGGGRIGYAEGSPMAGLVYVGSWEGPWTGPEFLGGPRKGQYYNQPKSITAITGPDGAIPRPGMPITTIQSPQQSETISTPEIPLTVQERYNKYLSAAGSGTSDDLYKLYRASVNKKANGGRIGYADGSNDAPSITLDSYKDGRLKPEDPLSKYKSYSEQELLENIEAKYPNQLQSFSLEDYQLNTMPMFKPKDVAPPKSYSPMPVEKYLRGRYQLDLAGGGRVNFEKGTVPRMLKFLIDKLADEKNFNKTLLEKSNPKAIQELYIEQYGKLPSAEEIKNIVNKQLQNKGSMETVNPKTGEVTTPKEPVTIADKKRQLTKEEIEDYEEAIGRNSEEWMSEGTVEEAEKALKRSKAEEAYYLQQYKTGQLDPTPGEKSQSRMRFLQKKAEDAELTGDRRLFSLDEFDELEGLENTFNKKNTSAGGFDFNDPEIKAQMEKAMQEGNKRSKEMRAMGLDPAKSKDYDEYIKIKEASGDKDFNKYFDDLEIKTKFKGRISDDLLNQILTDDNLQRKAEVVAGIEQGLVMQEKGMSPEQIVDILKNTKRTKQAQGGSIGLDYLTGL